MLFECGVLICNYFLHCQIFMTAYFLKHHQIFNSLVQFVIHSCYLLKNFIEICIQIMYGLISLDMIKNDDKFSIEFKVRDYECDIQGVVNNANYLHYIEHARHEYLLSKGISFVKFHDEGIDMIVTRIEIDYKYPLRGGDKFIVTVEIQREGNIRLIFNQNILRVSDASKVIAEAKVTGVATKKGRPIAPPSDILMLLELE